MVSVSCVLMFMPGLTGLPTLVCVYVWIESTVTVFMGLLVLVVT